MMICLVFFRRVGCFLSLSPQYCFVIDDNDGICAYALAALEVKSFYAKHDNEWIPAMKNKYEKPAKKAVKDLTPAEVCLEHVFLDPVNLEMFVCLFRLCSRGI
jgi:protein O-GlcNAcase/histone acetyltransferase